MSKEVDPEQWEVVVLGVVRDLAKIPVIVEAARAVAGDYTQMDKLTPRQLFFIGAIIGASTR